MVMCERICFTVDNCECLERMSPEQALVANMFIRAVRDALETSRLPREDVRNARVWLTQPNSHIGSALWWAELADLEPLLERCRQAIRDKLNGRPTLLRGRPGYFWSVGYYQPKRANRPVRQLRGEGDAVCLSKG